MEHFLQFLFTSTGMVAVGGYIYCLVLFYNASKSAGSSTMAALLDGIAWPVQAWKVIKQMKNQT